MDSVWFLGLNTPTCASVIPHPDFSGLVRKISPLQYQSLPHVQAIKKSVQPIGQNLATIQKKNKIPGTASFCLSNPDQLINHWSFILVSHLCESMFGSPKHQSLFLTLTHIERMIYHKSINPSTSWDHYVSAQVLTPSMVQFKLRTPLPSSGGAGAVLIRLDGGDAKSFDPENCIVAWLGWSVRRMMGKHGENTGKTQGRMGKHRKTSWKHKKPREEWGMQLDKWGKTRGNMGGKGYGKSGDATCKHRGKMEIEQANMVTRGIEQSNHRGVLYAQHYSPRNWDNHAVNLRIEPANTGKHDESISINQQSWKNLGDDRRWESSRGCINYHNWGQANMFTVWDGWIGHLHRFIPVWCCPMTFHSPKSAPAKPCVPVSAHWVLCICKNC